MAKFDESKIITPLHPEKAEVGKKYWIEDTLIGLKKEVEEARTAFELQDVKQENRYPFIADTGVQFQFLYPYEEPSKQRMTNRQLAEWLSKGNGQWIDFSTLNIASTVYAYEYLSNDNDEVPENIHIRPFGTSDWIEPTVDIFKESKC